MNTLERRSLLATTPNPDPKLDYVTALKGTIPPGEEGGETTIALRYVPDKLILDPAAFGRYLEALKGPQWGSLEEVAVIILNDINNEVVARWVQVSASAPDGAHAGVAEHGVLVEDRQPRWDNPALLSRLRRG